ncbi:MAG: zinc ribbon domain-containing protein [Candidatus Methanomethylophilaceae archaeon]|nr:zinc ribbon domain-containing protein [Candidatus Methanomethylophilaceae archaeon]
MTHADGTVDTSTETFECSECGKEVPANAKRCPYCGAEFDEEDD